MIIKLIMDEAVRKIMKGYESLAYTKSGFHAAQFGAISVIVNSFVESFGLLWGL